MARLAYILALLGAFVTAQAPEELDADVYGPNPEVDDADAENNVWQQWEISDFVDQKFGPYQWSFIEEHIMTEQSRDNLVTGFVSSLVDTWSGQAAATLPVVCHAGEVCREQKFRVAMNLIVDEWSSLLETIDSVMVTSISSAERLVEEAHSEAYDCEPGCTCDNIMIEYNDIIRVQKELVKKIVTTGQTITTHLETEKDIVEICPNYGAIGLDGEYVEASMVADDSAQKIEDILYPPTIVGDDPATWGPPTAGSEQPVDEVTEEQKADVMDAFSNGLADMF